MNEQVRSYLIEIAREKEKFVSYSDVVKECGLSINLKSNFGRNQLTNLLSEISEFEDSHGRPLISAMAIYKDPNLNGHGDGFYIVAEKLKKGKFSKLKDALFGFTEAAACRSFWQNNENYKKYFQIKTAIRRHQTIEDLFKFLLQKKDNGWVEEDWKIYYVDFTKDVQVLQGMVRDHPELPIDNTSLYAKLSKDIQSYESFMRKWLKEKSNGISSRGQSVLSKDNFEKIIHDPIFKAIAKEVISNPTVSSYDAFMQWWHNNPDINNRPLLVNRALAACNPEVLSSVVDNSKFWRVIEVLKESYDFEFIGSHDGNWYKANEQLTQWLDKALTDALKSKSPNRQEQMVWRNIFVWLVYAEFKLGESISPNTLIKRDKPNGVAETIAERKREFKGVDIDFHKQAGEFKNLGDAGETLVMQREIEFLKKKGLHGKAKLVDVVKDGMGYDVLSFNEKGEEKYIEVKTTGGNEHTPFYLSENELGFMRLNKKNFSIYRVYNYDEEFNCAEYFELDGDIESQLLLKPTQYKVTLKKIKI